MFGSEVTPGRTVLVVLEPGDGVIDGLIAACRRFGIEGAYIPVFLGAFTELIVIGSDHAPEDEDAPMPSSVLVRNCEGIGSGTVTRGVDGPLVHLHASVGAKGESARATAGHVLGGTVQYPTEVVITEILSPVIDRVPNARARGLATLSFDPA